MPQNHLPYDRNQPALWRPTRRRKPTRRRRIPLSDSQKGLWKTTPEHHPGFGSQDRILRAILWMSWTLWTKWTRKSIPLRVKSTGSTMSISSMVWSKEPRSTADFRIISRTSQQKSRPSGAYDDCAMSVSQGIALGFQVYGPSGQNAQYRFIQGQPSFIPSITAPCRDSTRRARFRRMSGCSLRAYRAESFRRN